MLAALPACSAQLAQSEKLGDGTHRIRCESSLATCLRTAEELCPSVSYDVLRARDRRVYTGVAPAEVQHRSSEAIVECGSRGMPLVDEPDLAEQVTDSQETDSKDEEKAAPLPEPRRACIPGLMQGCTGIGGCSGGQACLADGSGFGPCQCATGGETDEAATDEVNATPEIETPTDPGAGSSTGQAPAKGPDAAATDGKAPAPKAPR